MHNVIPPKSRHELAKENQELRTALDAALRAMTPFEEPGRHFGSPLFVSLACVLSNQADQACWDVINDYIAAEQKREEAGIPVEYIKPFDIAVKIGKKLDSYMLPDDVVENRAVHLVIDALRDTPESNLRMLTKRQLGSLIDEELHDAELEAAVKILERSDVNVLKQVWIFTDPRNEKEYCLDDAERKAVLETGVFVHPNIGVAINDFRAHLSVYHALNTDNQEFMSWKAEFEPAAMKM